MTEKQRRFVEAYMGQAAGNATEAARLAGYSGTTEALAVRGAENVRKSKVREAIEQLQQNDPLVATREERQRFWSEVLRGDIEAPVTMPDRLKASELLGKASGDFTDRMDVDVLIRFAEEEE